MSTVIPADIDGRVRSLEEIFKSLHVSSDGCQKMLVCHLSKVNLIVCVEITNPNCCQDQEEFSPLSHLVLDLLELDTAQVTPGVCSTRSCDVFCSGRERKCSGG